MTVEKNPREQGARYGHSIRGLRDQTGGSARLYHKGPLCAVHSTAPPPVEEYDEWLAGYFRELSQLSRNKSPITGFKLRRIVIMRRQGEGFAACGSAIGLTGHSAGLWHRRLPPELSA